MVTVGPNGKGKKHKSLSGGHPVLVSASRRRIVGGSSNPQLDEASGIVGIYVFNPNTQ